MVDLPYKILSESTSVTDIVGSKIYSEYREPGSATPAVSIDLVGVSPVHTGRSSVKAEQVSFKLRCYGKTLGETLGLSTAVREAIAGLSGTFTMANGDAYTVAKSYVDSYDLDTDYDGQLSASEIEISIHITH